MANEVAERPSGELAPLSQEEQALVDAAKAGIDRSKLVLPALKLTQSLTAEVQEGDVEAGHFINSLTGEDFGDGVKVVISALFDGRFYSDDDGNSFAAQGEVAPDNWPEEYAGKPFADIPDAEEQWKAAVNAGEHSWGKGPPISTTHNFVGYVVDSDSDLPVRISLMRSSNPAAFKLQTLIFAARAPWDRTFILKAKREVSKDRPYFVVEVGQGEPTSDELRQQAVSLAQEFQTARAAGTVELAGDEESEAPKTRKPKKKGKGLDVG